MTEYKADNYIEIYGGGRFDWDNIQKNKANINVIAHSLSRQNRYAGHCKVEDFTVAEHSVLMADAIMRDTGDPVLAFEALLHDATEAYVCDIPRPMKAILPKYQELEAEVQKIISRDFNIPLVMTPIIKEYDSRIVKDERAVVMCASDNVWAIDKLKSLDVKIECMRPDKAKAEFLEAYSYLLGEMQIHGSA